jgi:DNA-binding transcriptional LysR family regulator
LTLGTYFLPPLLAAFRKKYPHIEIHMKVRNKQEVIGDILSQTDDFGFIGYMEPDGKLELTPLWEEELVLVVPPFHPFTRLKSVSLADLNDQSLIFRERGSGTREWVEKILQQEGVSVRGVMELGSHEAIKRAVEVGLGISFLPICAIGRKQDPPLLRVIPLRQKIYLNYYMIYGKNQYLSHSMRAFLKMVLELSHPSRKPVLDKGAFPPYNLST